MTTPFLHLLALFVFAVSALAESERGTLTLRGDKVVYYTHAGGNVSYAVSEIPGLHVVGYEKKTRYLGGRDFDVSELTLEGNGPIKIILFESVPVVVLHDSKSKTWALAEKK